MLADTGLTVEAAMISKRSVAALAAELMVVNAMATSDRKEELVGSKKKDTADWMLQSKEHWSYL